MLRVYCSFTRRLDLHYATSHIWVFVCFWFFIPIKNVSLIWRRHQYQSMATIFYLCLAIEQWVFLNVPHLLWHGASVYYGFWSSPRNHDTHTYCRAFGGSGAVITLCYDLGLSWMGFQHPIIHLWGQRSNPLFVCTTAVLICVI